MMSFFRKPCKSNPPARLPGRAGSRAASFRPGVETLEARALLTVYTPTTFADSNDPKAGSFRDAILAANADQGTAQAIIVLGAGTYTLTLQNPARGRIPNAQTGALDITNTKHEL